MHIEQAELIAIKALEFIAGQEAVFQQFLASTGMDLTDLKHIAESPHFLAGVVSFLRQDESACSMFACNIGLKEHELELVEHLLSSHPVGE